MLKAGQGGPRSPFIYRYKDAAKGAITMKNRIHQIIFNTTDNVGCKEFNYE